MEYVMVELCVRVLPMHLSCAFVYVLGYGLCLSMVSGYVAFGFSCSAGMVWVCYVVLGFVFSFWLRLLP